jgi:hypothetical protein
MFNVRINLCVDFHLPKLQLRNINELSISISATKIHLNLMVSHLKLNVWVHKTNIKPPFKKNWNACTGHLLFGICFFLLKLVIYSGLKKLKSIISCNSKIVLAKRVSLVQSGLHHHQHHHHHLIEKTICHDIAELALRKIPSLPPARPPGIVVFSACLAEKQPIPFS